MVKYYFTGSLKTFASVCNKLINPFLDKNSEYNYKLIEAKSPTVNKENDFHSFKYCLFIFLQFRICCHHYCYRDERYELTLFTNSKCKCFVVFHYYQFCICVSSINCVCVNKLICHHSNGSRTRKSK